MHTEWRDGNSGPWTLDGSAIIDGTGTHQLQTAAVDAAGNRDERTDVVKIDNTLPVDTTVTPCARLARRRGRRRRPGHRRRTPVWTTSSGSSTAAPDRSRATLGTTVRISTHGQHDLQDPDRRRRRQPVRLGHRATCGSTSQGPRTRRSSRPLVHDALDRRQRDGRRQRRLGIKKLQWRLDTNTTGQVAGHGHGPGHGQRRRRAQARSPRHRQAWTASSSGSRTTSRSTPSHPTDTTNVATGWLPYASLNVTVRGTDATSEIERVEWRIDGGGNVDSAPGSSHDVADHRPGSRTRSRPASWTTPASPAPGSRSSIKLDSTLPTNTSPSAPTGWRNTPYSVVLNGTDAGSGVASVGWKLQLEGDVESAEQRRCDRAWRRSRSPRTARTR